MAGKAGELKLATTAKHIAEAQVEDLQRRVLDLQRLRAAAVKLASHSSGSDPASPQVGCSPLENRETKASSLLLEKAVLSFICLKLLVSGKIVGSYRTHHFSGSGQSATKQMLESAQAIKVWPCTQMRVQQCCIGKDKRLDMMPASSNVLCCSLMLCLQSEGGTDEEREAMAEQLEALQQTIAERDSELLALNQELSDLADRLPVRSSLL